MGRREGVVRMERKLMSERDIMREKASSCRERFKFVCNSNA